MSTLSGFKHYTDTLKTQSKKTPVLFTSHGSPLDIPLSTNECPFWATLSNLGKTLRAKHDIKAVVVISAHWETKGTFVNSSLIQKQIYDYYGFPEHYYDPKYNAHGAPELAKELNKIIPEITDTQDWGLDHGAWPMLMHLFPKADVPVFQLSLDYTATPQQHYNLGKQLQGLRKKGVLIIGSGALIHNLPLAMKKLQTGDTKIYGWEAEYDYWLKQQIDHRNFKNLIHYKTSHSLGHLASPTPDHFLPVLYSLGLVEQDEDITYFYDGSPNIPAFSERSFIVG
ncbi:dioxygenase [Algibacter amylolyticus]|uniref:Dioxygenase n=1 Tax=Algibacter amylolyticus TaxID=1608400 RepID=A0A5M7B237_9FLAO|nr:class III extradiol ring-cleavage dioxygenase [Algibacter amylolyticus]KAA5823542.1 dioxygenase [Algibacter amylolyticus]MBB5267696.1 4,5-DOPA dioxygenase extradiol [Algibacter amylolyticus]TSJ74030.1 dioxygenase [Algibacter amylolyticus]